MMRLRLDGYTYKRIADDTGVSRQRIQQLLSPPKEVRNYVIRKYNGQCADCGIIVGRSGHVHHNDSDLDTYNDIDNLVLLCISCHRQRHNEEDRMTRGGLDNVSMNIRLPRTLTKLIGRIAGMECKTNSQWVREAVEGKLKEYNLTTLNQLVKEK